MNTIYTFTFICITLPSLCKMCVLVHNLSSMLRVWTLWRNTHTTQHAYNTTCLLCLQWMVGKSIDCRVFYVKTLWCLQRCLYVYPYTLNKYMNKTLIKLPDWRKTTRNCRVMGIILLSAHKRPIYPTHFADSPFIYSPYHGYNYSYVMLTNFIGSSYRNSFFLQKCYLYRAVYW